MRVNDQSVPQLVRHARLRHDKVRDRWVLMSPEQVLMPDDTAVAILQKLDGTRTVTDVVTALATEYDAPADMVRADTLAFLQQLADLHLLQKAE